MPEEVKIKCSHCGKVTTVYPDRFHTRFPCPGCHELLSTNQMTPEQRKRARAEILEKRRVLDKMPVAKVYRLTKRGTIRTSNDYGGR